MSTKHDQKSKKLIISPSNPDDLWESRWNIYANLKELKQQPLIGWISFAGEKDAGTIPMEIEITDPEDRNRGYGTEAIRIMTDWVFLHKNIFEITAVSEHENSGYIMALQKAGFVLREASRETEYYSITKQGTSWTGLYLAIGIVVGLILAFILNNGWVGLGIGVFFCLVIGSSMDIKEKKYRESVTGKHYK